MASRPGPCATPTPAPSGVAEEGTGQATSSPACAGVARGQRWPRPSRVPTQHCETLVMKRVPGAFTEVDLFPKTCCF